MVKSKPKLDITWVTGDPRVITSCDPVRYLREVQVERKGKMVTETVYIEFTACGSRPATEADVALWRAQP